MAEAAILDVIRKVRETGVTEAERQRAIITAESSYAFDIETAEGLAKSYGQAETTWTPAVGGLVLERPGGLGLAVGLREPLRRFAVERGRGRRGAAGPLPLRLRRPRPPDLPRHAAG